MAEGPAPGGGRGEDPAGRPVPGGTPGGGTAGGGGCARGFASGGPLDTALPSAALTRDLDRASGPGRRCEGAADDEVAGMLGRWEATKAWCASGKLGVIRTLIRRRALPGYEPARPGGLPGAWQEGLTQEVSGEMGVSPRAADALIDLAAALDTPKERFNALTRGNAKKGNLSPSRVEVRTLSPWS